MGRKRSWNDAELELLKQYYPVLTIKEILKKIPGKTYESVRYYARILGLVQDTGAVREKWKKMFEDRLPDHLIGYRMGVSIAHVREIKRRLGFQVGNAASIHHSNGVAAEDRADKIESKSERLDRMHGVYDTEQTEFLKMIDQFRRKKGRVPTLLEGFRIAKEMGYRLVAEPDPEGPQKVGPTW